MKRRASRAPSRTRTLQDSEERYRTLFDTVREIICTATPDGRFVSFNAAFHALTGWRKSDWIGRPFAEILHDEDLPACLAAFEVALRGTMGPSVRHRMLTRSKQWLVVESTAAPLFRDRQVTGVLGVVRDVTARVQAEEALVESRRRLSALFDNALDAILLMDDAGHYVDANPAAAELLGYSPEELRAMTALDVIPPHSQAQDTAAVQQFRETGRYAGDYQVLRKDGTVREADFRSVAHILPGLHLAIVRDVTERKRAEEELRQSQRRLKEAEAVAHVGSWEWDPLTNALTWSDEMYRLFGVSPDNFRPTYGSSLERVHPSDRTSVDEVCNTAAREGRDYSWDARILRPNGEVRFMHARGHAILGSDGSVTRMIGIAQDVTEQIRAGELRRALVHRLISIQEEERARLSRELHDGTGQALAAVLVGLRRLEAARSLKAVRLAASRQREIIVQTIDEVGRIARGLRPTTLDDLGLRAALERHTADQAWLFKFRVTLDAVRLGRRRLPSDIETVLYRVAQEALANAGRHAHARHVRIVLLREDRYARLTVTDDGTGFDVDHALTIVGRMGLHTMRERAAVLDGRVDISSRKGEGTTVSLVIPLAESPRPSRSRAGRAPSAGRRRQHR